MCVPMATDRPVELLHRELAQRVLVRAVGPHAVREPAAHLLHRLLVRVDAEDLGPQVISSDASDRTNRPSPMTTTLPISARRRAVESLPRWNRSGIGSPEVGMGGGVVSR